MIDFAGKGNGAAMPLNDPGSGRKSQTRAAGLVSEEWVKEMRVEFLWDPLPGIRHLQHDGGMIFDDGATGWA